MDSGIDPSYFGDEWQRIRRYKSFTSDHLCEVSPLCENSPLCKDSSLYEDSSTDRHGTHIAAVILRLTKNVDIYIGKVTESSMIRDTEKVAQVRKPEWDAGG